MLTLFNQNRLPIAAKLSFIASYDRVLAIFAILFLSQKAQTS